MSTAEQQRTVVVLKELDAAIDYIIDARTSVSHGNALDAAHFIEVAIAQLRAALVGIGGTS